MMMSSRHKKITAPKHGLINMKPPEEIEQEFEEILNSRDPEIVKLLNKVADVFQLFDQANQNIIDVREVGCIVRSLGLYPSEGDVHEIIQVVEDPSTQGVVKYERFAPYIVKILLDGKMYEAPTTRQIRMAFQVLDTEKVGYFDLERMQDIMMKEGEPFSSDEFDEMMRFGFNEEDQKFDWRVYLKKNGLREG